MKTNEKKNTSAKKKLIPAVAMLTTSAVMLSTATYAWFTMNKDAEVTGLEMTATAGGSIEISLGQLGTDGLPTVTEGASTVSSPAMDNKSWKSVIAVSDYYSKINKIKPASSINASDLYYVDDDSVYAGGRAVDDKTAITKTTADNEVPLAVRKTGDSAGLATVDNASNGYYLDIPVWIRTSQQKTQTVTCDVIINDNGDAVQGSELTKAVRVAVVPLTASKDTNVAMKGTSPAISESANYATDVSNISVFALNQDNYTANNAIGAEKTKDTGTYAGSIQPITYSKSEAKSEVPTPTTATTKVVFDLDGAAKDSYSVQGFVVRVWLEGESQYCNDTTAAQDWNIQLDFTGAEKTE